MKIYSVQAARIDDAAKEYKRIQKRQETNSIIRGDVGYLSPEYALGIALKWHTIGIGDLYESKTRAYKAVSRLNRASRDMDGCSSIVYFVVAQYVIKGEGR